MGSPVDAPANAAQQRYTLVRQQIESEDGLITQRLNWFVAAQSFLFTAYAITLNAPPDNQSASARAAGQHMLLFHLIPLVALSACLLIYFTVLAGVLAQRHLRDFMRDYAGDASLIHHPPLQGTLLTRAMGLSAPLGLPVVFAAVWIYLFISGLS